MALLDSLIISICAAGTQGQGTPACNASVKAAAQQSGVAQSFNNGEKIIDNMATKDAQTYLGNTTIYMVGGAVYISKVIQNKGLDFELPNLGICDSLSNHIGMDNYGLKFTWKFK